ncbi:GntR family transcriptional regulator [Noviherbaspirillum pedocola]|uniref:GntR family transcriptional regulator n=1 Tax=Noviherbaspirillum pedocola TaxID=2801341 RepID=A0A934STI7_9BURK|nr:GntR family transcriptional regulator [Noviherbaspirillum pedocola]MBK4735382.1 GntR family transcriptional regulator [Noviherbaspirillum pedocola]
MKRHPRLVAAPDAEPASTESADAAAQRVYQTIFDSVMSQRLLPGTKLPEAALCELFHVGRTTVQKALQRLAHEYIVELRPNRGAMVAMPTPQEMREIFEARQALEAAILGLAARNATDEDLARLHVHLEREHAVMHTWRQAEWARLASDFHLRVAELSHNAILQRYLAELLSRCSLIVALHEPGGHASCEHEEHAGIVACLERRDAEGAVRAMQAHLAVLEQRIQLDSEGSGKNLARMLGFDER